jgi:hypothetical protein
VGGLIKEVKPGLGFGGQHENVFFEGRAICVRTDDRTSRLEIDLKTQHSPGSTSYNRPVVRELDSMPRLTRQQFT